MRRLFAATLVDGVLQVTGTGGNDVVCVFEEDRTANGQPGGTFEGVIVVKVNNQRMANLTPMVLKLLVMQGGDGNDSLEVLRYLTFDGIIFDRGNRI